MEKLLDLTKDDNRGEHPTGASPPHVSVDRPVVETESNRRRRKLHRVPSQMQENKKYVYDPMVLSFGPYHHHGGPRFRQVEELKEEVLNMPEYSSVKGLFHRKILERVDEIRNFYGGLPTHEYNNDTLAEMLFRDACFLLCYIRMCADIDNNKNYYRLFIDRVGRSGISFMDHDFYMLENQIPFWVIKLLISLTFDDKNKEEQLLCKFLSFVGDRKIRQVPWEYQNEPLHLLEAYRATLVKRESGTFIPVKWQRSRTFKSRWGRSKRYPNTRFEYSSSPFRSVAELKAKGIYFGRSSSCLQDIKFDSYSFYGKLQLPICHVNRNSKVFFSNIIAFETSPETFTDCAVTSYVNFMQTLIENSNDVKELREKGILCSSLPNDEVVKMFKEIDTYGANNDVIFRDIEMRIKEHCDSRAKTWMAEFTNTYFSSPWNIIALFAATYLLLLATLQTYYTMYPNRFTLLKI